MRHSIKSRLLIALFGLAIVPLLLAGIANVTFNYQHYTETELAQLDEVSLRVRTQTESILRQGEGALLELLRYRHFLALSTDSQSALLSELVSTHDYLREVALLGADGQERLRASAVSLSREPSHPVDHALVSRSIATGNSHYGVIRNDPFTGEPLLPVAVPIPDRYRGAVAAVFYAELRLKGLWELLASLPPHGDLRVYVVDERGEVIAHQNPSVVLRRTRLPADPASVRTGLSGNKVFLVARPLQLGDRGFRVVAEHNWRGAMQPLFNHLWMLGGILAVALAVAVAAGVFALRRVAGPILKVEATARAIAGGDMETRVAVESDDEIGQLARSFNGMTEHLQQTLNELRQQVRVREEVEEALRDSAQRFQQVADTIQEIFWLSDWPSNRVAYISPAFERVWGTRAHELSARPTAWMDSIEETDRATVENLFLNCVNNGGFDATFRIVRPDGSRRVIHSRGFPVRNPAGEVYRIAGVAQDVTERVEAENTLRATREMLQLVIDTMPLRVFWKDREARYLGCNQHFAEDAGLAPGESIIGKGDGDLAWRDQADQYRRDDFKVMESGNARLNVTETHVTSAGDSRWFDTSKVPLRDADGRVVGVLGVYQEITAQKEAEAQLARATAEWNYAMDFYADPIYLLDLERRVVRANRAFYAMTTQTEGEVIGRQIADLIHPEGEEEPCPVCRMQMQLRDGTVVLEADHPSNPAGVPIEVIARIIRGDKGAPSGILMTIRDLSRSRHTSERLRQAAAVFESTQEGVLITDPEGNIAAVNPAFTTITGYAEREVLGKNPRLLASGRHDRDFFNSMWLSISKSGGWNGEIWNRRKSGEVYPEWLNINVVKGDDGRIVNYVGAFSDISKLKRAQEKLEFLAHHDPLTNLPNRLLLWARLRYAMQRAERRGTQVALLFLDLDRFKDVNDSLGHTFGDALLQAAAERLLGTLRGEDTVARLGGDEFTVVVEGVDEQSAIVVAEKLIAAVGEPYQIQEREICIGASIGISLFPRDGRDVEVLLRNADAAMYRAKDAGRNTYRFYAEEMTARALDRVVLERQLRRAIEEEQLVLHYQPQIDLRSGKTVGVEALVRWKHAELGMVSPDRFIPLAEETGLILPLGEWVLRDACRQAKTWLDRGIEFGRVAVNVAGPQIQRTDLAAMLQRVLDETALPPSRLELEVTESFIMGQAEKAADLLHRIRAMGVELAIDDFGTGYSSLSYLKRLPFNKLKIDRIFICDLPQDGNGAAIARAIIALGRSMQFQIVAEGVETAAQAAFLAHEGCGEAQGFHYARPMPALQFEGWVEERSALASDPLALS